MKGEKNMKGLTKQELETLMEIFNQSAIALYKAIRKYVKLMAKESEFDNDKAVETYVKSDIIALNKLYSEKVGE